MKSKILSYIAFGLIASIGLTGCVSPVQLADESVDAEAKEFSPSSGMASVYVYVDCGGYVPVGVNGRYVAQVNKYSFLYSEVEKGFYTFRHINDRFNVPLELEITEAKPYFVTIDFGWASTAYKEVRDTEKAKSEIMKRKAALRLAKLRPENSIDVHLLK